MKCVKNRAVQGVGTAALMVLFGLALWLAGTAVAAVWNSAAVWLRGRL